MATAKTTVSLVSQVGPAHPTVKAVHPVSALVYPVYYASANTNLSSFVVIKNNEILGPYADPVAARDEIARRIQIDIERGIPLP